MRVIKVREHSKEAQWQDPCVSHVLKDVICTNCGHTTDLDLCRDHKLVAPLPAPLRPAMTALLRGEASSASKDVGEAETQALRDELTRRWSCTCGAPYHRAALEQVGFFMLREGRKESGREERRVGGKKGEWEGRGGEYGEEREKQRERERERERATDKGKAIETHNSRPARSNVTSNTHSASSRRHRARAVRTRRKTSPAPRRRRSSSTRCPPLPLVAGAGATGTRRARLRAR